MRLECCFYRRKNQRDFCTQLFENEITKQGLSILGWRKVPVNRSVVGRIAQQTEPYVAQVFVGKGDTDLSDSEFNVKLFTARKISEHKIISSKLSQSKYFYFPSLSTHTLIYKGLLVPEDIEAYYLDLSDPLVVTRLALVHQRFSTNTFPTWDLAQPFRYMCHNGEINTFRGNYSRMQIREELFKSNLIGDEIKDILPVILKGKSDSASMDMVVELLLATGRSLPEVMMMLVPEAWEKHKSMDPLKSVLSIQFLHHGTLGWTSFYSFYRWKIHWSFARSKWSSPIPIHSNQRWVCSYVFRSWGVGY